MMFIERIGVVGAGQMGAAIAQVMALNGKEVVLKDVDPKFVEAGLERTRAVLSALVDFHAQKAPAEIARIEKMGVALTAEQKDQVRAARAPTYTTERAEQTLARIHPTTTYDDLADVDLVIEAVVEDVGIKQKVFAELEKATKPHVVLATNTSMLPVSKIGEGLKERRSKFLGVHFFNPPYTLPLVEVVPTDETDPDTTEGVVQFLEELRNHRYPMQPIVCKERPGYVVNRILAGAMREAFIAYEDEAARPRDIDKACVAGLGWPMGPLELADLVGLDVISEVTRTLKEVARTEQGRDPTIIEKLFNEGRLGKKSGHGFYSY